MKTILSFIAFLFLQITVFAQIPKLNCDSTFKDTDGATIYICADKKPVFPGGFGGYEDFIEKNLKYPPKAFEANTQGEIVVQIIVDEKGRVKPFKIVETIKGPGADQCEKEAMRLMGILPKVEPALIKGKPVRMTLRTVVEFRTEPEVLETIIELGGETIVGDDYPPPPPPPPPPFEGENTSLPTEEEVSDTTVFNIVEQMPEFPGWEYGLMKYVNESIQYPKNCGDSQGTVFVQFIVERDGSVSHATVRSSFSGPYSAAFDTEALRVINSLPKFTPGMHNGKPARVGYVLPVIFNLQ